MVDICALGQSIDVGPLDGSRANRIVTVECEPGRTHQTGEGLSLSD